MERGRLGPTALLAFLLGALLPTGTACTWVNGPPEPAQAEPAVRATAPLGAFEYQPLDPKTVKIQPEGLTVEQSWLLDLYTLFHSRDYKAFRIVLTDEKGEERHGHLLIPPGDGPHPAVVAFEILDGPQDVSEGMAKALVDRGYAVARMDRRNLDLDHQSDPAVVRDTMREGVIDARRLLDWLVTHPKIDRTRLGAAGVSLGSMQALLLTSCDPRIRGGFYVMTGGNLPEMFYESSELAVRRFRDRLMESRGWSTREQFLDGIRPDTQPIDPLTYSSALNPANLMLATGRFDTVIPSSNAQQLWEALDQPTWFKLPCGHYTLFPFFWWTMSRGADHLDRVLAPNTQLVGAGL
jgi:hypothetical protein